MPKLFNSLLLLRIRPIQKFPTYLIFHYLPYLSSTSYSNNNPPFKIQSLSSHQHNVSSNLPHTSIKIRPHWRDQMLEPGTELPPGVILATAFTRINCPIHPGFFYHYGPIGALRRHGDIDALVHKSLSAISMPSRLVFNLWPRRVRAPGAKPRDGQIHSKAKWQSPMCPLMSSPNKRPFQIFWIPEVFAWYCNGHGSLSWDNLGSLFNCQASTLACLNRLIIKYHGSSTHC